MRLSPIGDDRAPMHVALPLTKRRSIELTPLISSSFLDQTTLHKGFGLGSESTISRKMQSDFRWAFGVNMGRAGSVGGLKAIHWVRPSPMKNEWFS